MLANLIIRKKSRNTSKALQDLDISVKIIDLDYR